MTSVLDEHGTAAAPEAAAVLRLDPEPASGPAPQLRPRRSPHLRLVPPHQHDWRLRETDYEAGGVVRRFECDACGDVEYR